MGRRGRQKSDDEELLDEDNSEEIRIDRGKKKRKPWQDDRRERVGESELDPLWEVRPKR